MQVRKEEKKEAVKMLPIEKSPVTGYSHQAFLFSILLPHPETLPWLYSNYIQLFTLKDLYRHKERPGAGDFFFNYYGDWQFFELKCCPWLRYQSVPYKLIFSDRTIHQFIQESIDSDNYVKLPVEVAFIKAYGNLQIQGYHDLLIYGYDTGLNLYYAVDNFADDRYQYANISFEEMENASKGVIEYNLQEPCFRDNVTCIKFERCFNQNSDMISLNISKIANDMKEFLLWKGYGESYKDIAGYSYGITYYDELIKYCSMSGELEEDIDVRCFATLRDHKNLMYQRTEYLIRKDILKEENLLEAAAGLKDQMDRIVYLLLIYNKTKQERRIRELLTVLNNLKQQDTMFCENLIKCLTQT